MRRSLLVLGWLMACTPLTPPQVVSDGGSGGGNVAQGGGGGGGDGATGGGLVGGGDGSTGGGVGVTGGGGTSGFSWVNFSFSPPSTATPIQTRQVLGLSRFDALWVMLSDGALYRAEGRSLTLTKLGEFDISTTEHELLDLAVGDAGVFVLRAGDVLRCAGSCNAPTDFTTLLDFSGIENGYAFCSRDSRIALVTLSNDVTKLYEFNHDTQVFDEVSIGSVSWGERCFIDDLGDLYLPSLSGVLRVMAGGGYVMEAVDAGTLVGWRAVAVSDGGGLLVGGGSGVRFARRSGDAWLGWAPILTDGLMQVALPLRPGEFMGAGTYNGEGGTTVYRYEGSTLTPYAPQPAIHVSRGLAASPDEVYLGGATSDDGDFSVMRGTR